MGDDLIAARRICDTVRSDIALLMDAICAQPPASPDILMRPLDRIQTHAKQMHARGIFRAAQTVVNSLMDHAPLPTVQGRALSLNKLITQYELGLDEIAPRAANLQADDLLSVSAVSQSEAPAEIIYAETEPPMPDVEARFRAARVALAPLMVHAKQGQERSALIKLAKFEEHEIPQPVTVKSQKLPTVEPQETFLNFEMLMPEFIGHALQEARQVDKTVSVSYAADEVKFPQSQLSALRDLFDHIAKTLVRSVLERPETRRARGLSGAGHIALTATQTPEAIRISIECPGAPLVMSAFSPSANSPAQQAALGDLSILPGVNANEGRAHIVLTVPRQNQKKKLEPQIKSNSAEMAS